MKIKVTKSEKTYIISGIVRNKNTFTLKDLGSLIRKGNELDVRCTDDYDYTKETLVKIAFENSLPSNTNNAYIEILSEFLTESLLYLIIENGGYASFKRRSAKNAIFYKMFCFEQIEEFIKTFLMKGGDAQDIQNFVYNTVTEVQ